MISPRMNHTATLLTDGKVLIVGGNGGPALPVTLDSAEIYDPVTDVWSPAANLPATRTLHTATLLANGDVLIAGGMTSSGAGTPPPSTVALNGLVYDPSTNTWTSTGNFQHPRESHTATLLSNGQVLMAGGTNQSGVLPTTELYDPVANRWSPAGVLLEARAWHTATLLPSGKVLIAGGSPNPSEVTNSAELYDPVTNTSAAAGTLITPRYNQSATLLSNGVVLLVGGWGNSLPPLVILASSELYW
jgi:hypothetical protein